MYYVYIILNINTATSFLVVELFNYKHLTELLLVGYIIIKLIKGVGTHTFLGVRACLNQ